MPMVTLLWFESVEVTRCDDKKVMDGLGDEFS
jgi:hypothetical protein